MNISFSTQAQVFPALRSEETYHPWAALNGPRSNVAGNSLMCLLIYSFIHSSIHSLIHSCIHPFIHACFQPFIHSCIQPCIHSLITHSFPQPSMHSFIHSSVHAFVYQSFMHSFPIHSCIRSVSHTTFAESSWWISHRLILERL